jgi:hypothetical protein
VLIGLTIAFFWSKMPHFFPSYQPKATSEPIEPNDQSAEAESSMSKSSEPVEGSMTTSPGKQINDRIDQSE